MITASCSNGWGKIELTLKKIKKRNLYKTLCVYGERGVNALSSATPVDTGTTASSWRYEINEEKDKIILSFHNDNLNNGVNIALILNYGHATGTGGWVEGRDYIDPAIQPIFNEILENIWKEAKLN